jgi:hypothetical protein
VGDFYPADQNFGPPPPDSQAIPIPIDAFVAAQPYVPPSPSLGVAVVAATPFNVDTQDLESTNVVDVVVASTGNFQTAGPPDLVTFAIAAQGGVPTGVLAFDVGLPTERFQIFLGNVNLFNLGVDLAGALAMFPEVISQLPPLVAQPPPPVALPPTVVNPTRPIVFFGTNWILVQSFDDFGYRLGGTSASPWLVGVTGAASPPAAGQHVAINVQRNGNGVINDTNLAVQTNINVSTQPPSGNPGAVPNVFP